MISVLLVHDSRTVRASLRATLEQSGRIRVVGEAPDGRDVVELVTKLKPDVVVMDVVMPEVDGWLATRRIMHEAPTPVILVSQVVDPRNVNVALEAIRAGALAIADPPPPVHDQHGSHRRENFLALVQSAARAKVGRVQTSATQPGATTTPRPLLLPRKTRSRARAIGIVTSAGGPAALATVLEALPPGDFAPLLVVQHLARGFAESLARWLGESAGQAVRVVKSSEKAERGTVYFPPEDRHLGITPDGTVIASVEPPEKQFRPSGDWLLRSLARSLQHEGAGAILTGMGADGALGALELRKAGGEVVAQDESTSVVYGMPAAAVARGGVNEVLPLDQIAQWIVEKSA